MSENGEIYTIGQKIYTATGSDGRDKSHLCCAITRSICGGEELLIRLVLRRCLVCARMVRGRYTMLLRETGMQRA